MVIKPRSMKMGTTLLTWRYDIVPNTSLLEALGAVDVRMVRGAVSLSLGSLPGAKSFPAFRQRGPRGAPGVPQPCRTKVALQLSS
jgi:hypothetical protein